MWIKSILVALLMISLIAVSQQFTVKNSPYLTHIEEILNEIQANETALQEKTITKRQTTNATGTGTGTPINLVPKAQRRQGQLEEAVEIYERRYPFIAALQIGEYTFSCRQDNGFLNIWQQLAGSNRFNVRTINGEFSFHPQPGLWWFVKCVGYETGGYGLDATGVSKPGGDSGINPNALKSLVG